MKDYYKILGVPRNASEEDIKKAFRKLAHEFHPDKAGGDEAKFKEINEAYQVLSNKEKRAQYDRFGQVFEGGNAAGEASWNPFGAGGFGFGNQAGFDVDFEDIFEGIFGGQRSGGKRANTSGSDIQIAIQITLSDAFKGLKRELSFKTFIECHTCGGAGYDKSKGVKKCPTCGGKGEIRENKRTFLGNFSQIRVCPDCFGRGEIPNSSCNVCKGEGRVFSTKTVSVNIAPGIEDGQAIKITGGGEAGLREGRNGDLYVKVIVLPDSRFVRKGSDLFETKDIKVAEALLLKDIPMIDLGGEKFSVSIPPGFSLKDKLKVQKRGMPKMGLGGRGDLYITFNLKLPKHLSGKAKKIIEELDDELND